jgi:hypothetical protein
MAKEVERTVRINADLYEQIKKVAEREERSVNGQMNVLLKRGLEASKQMPLFK